MNEIQFTVENHIATIHLNRQRVGNAFSTEMMEKWCNIFAEIQKKEDPLCRCKKRAAKCFYFRRRY